MKWTFWLAGVFLTAPHLAHAKVADECSCYSTRASTSADLTDGRVLLRLKLPIGHRDMQKITVDQRTTTVAGKSKWSMTQKISMSIEIEVLAVTADGDTELRYTFGPASAITEVPASGNPAIDNARPQILDGIKKSTDPIYEALEGRALQVTLSPRGQVVKFTGLKELFNAMVANVQLPTSEKTSIQSSLKAFVNSLGDKENGVLKLGSQLPEAPVGVGDSWSQVQSVKQQRLDVKTGTVNTVMGRSNGVVKVSSLIRMESPQLAKSSAAKSILILTLNGGGRGEMEIDEATGMTKSVSMTTNSVTRVNIPKKDKGETATSSTVYTRSSVVIETASSL